MTTVDLQRRYSVQDQVRQDQEAGFGLMFWMTRAGELVAPWWSPQRDRQLRAYAKGSDHFSGAEWMIGTKLAGVPYRVEARDSSVKSHVRLANEYQAILDNMVQFGQGWEVFWTKFFHDLWETDNGAFGEVIGEGDPNGPIKGPSLGLSHLDSTRCSRTSNPEFPVIYNDVSGKRYRFHHTRVIFRSQSPSSAAEMHNVGFSWLSRSINSVQRLIDIATYHQEKLGSRPQRGIITGKGIDAESILGAIQAADESMDNQGLRRFAKFPILAHPSLTEWSIELLNFVSLPDGFDERTTTEFAMFVIALAGGFPPRWLWPATAVGATKADAMYQHIAGTGGGATWHLNMMRDLLSYSGRAAEIGRLLPPKFLPKELRLTFDYQDDEQDRLQADVRDKRAKTRETDLNAGVTTVRVSREQALSDGDLTQAQFNQMELADGRLPNGDDVLTLFSSTDNLFLTLLDLGVDDPLAIDFNDPLDMLLEIEGAALDAQDQLIGASSRAEREKVDQAITALGKLKGLYQEIVTQQIAQEQAVEEGEELGEGEQLPEGGEEKELSTLELELKAFNYGAKVGEVISGQLARGAGGRFVSAAQLSTARSKLLADLIARLRAKRGETGKGGRQGAAAAKRAANRAAVAEKAGVGTDTLDAMARMRNGDPIGASEQEKLIAQGLAEVNADGSVTMTSDGRSLLSAANSGDVDRAKKALAKAGEPDKPPKAPRGKKTPEQLETERQLREEQRERERQEELALNRAESFDRASEEFDIDRGDLDALQSFGAGGPLTDEVANRLTETGLVEIGEDGRPRLTSDGRKFLSAAEKGDIRGALDTLSRAAEKVEEPEPEPDEDEEDDEPREPPPPRAPPTAPKEVGVTADPFDVDDKSVSDFGLNVRAAIRGLWSGQVGQSDFVFQMVSTIERQLKIAWAEGAQECGIAESELTPQEISARDNLINSQFPHLPGFAADIAEGSKANGGKLGPQLSRGQMWVNRYAEARNQAKQMACGDRKLKWTLGEAEHCSTCLKLNGKVKRGSQWEASGIYPQMRALECRGFNCQCSLVTTDDPMSKGPLPSVP